MISDQSQGVPPLILELWYVYNTSESDLLEVLHSYLFANAILVYNPVLFIDSFTTWPI